MAQNPESRLDDDLRTVLPEPVRQALAVGPGDVIAYEIVGDAVLLRGRKRAARAAYLAALNRGFADWDAPEDDEAFGYLAEERSTGP